MLELHTPQVARVYLRHVERLRDFGAVHEHRNPLARSTLERDRAAIDADEGAQRELAHEHGDAGQGLEQLLCRASVACSDLLLRNEAPVPGRPAPGKAA